MSIWLDIIIYFSLKLYKITFISYSTNSFDIFIEIYR